MTTATAPKTTTEGIPVGTIFVSTWGYEQTNVDFLRVTRVTAKTVMVEPIATEVTPAEAYMTYTAVPGKHAIGEPMRRRVHTYGSRPSISLNSFATATVWDGHPVLGSSYA